MGTLDFFLICKKYNSVTNCKPVLFFIISISILERYHLLSPRIAREKVPL